MGFSCHHTYSISYLFYKDIKASDLVFDISFFLNSMSSLTGLAFSTWIIKRLRGTWNTFAVSMAMFALRFLVYSFTTNPWYVLFVEPSHMLCYAVFLSAYVDHIKSISPDNVLNTMYGIAKFLVVWIWIRRWKYIFWIPL